MDLIIPVDLLPVPKTLFEFTFTLIGWQLGSAMSKIDKVGLDEAILKNLKWKGLAKWLLERMLHFFHHYWIGLLLLVFTVPNNWPDPLWMQGALYWFGYGLTVEDAQYHLRDTIKKVKK